MRPTARLQQISIMQLPILICSLFFVFWSATLIALTSYQKFGICLNPVEAIVRQNTMSYAVVELKWSGTERGLWCVFYESFEI